VIPRAINRAGALASLQGCQFGHEAKAAELARQPVHQSGASRGGATGGKQNRRYSAPEAAPHERNRAGFSSGRWPYSGRSRPHTARALAGLAAGTKPTATTVARAVPTMKSAIRLPNDQVRAGAVSQDLGELRASPSPQASAIRHQRHQYHGKRMAAAWEKSESPAPIAQDRRVWAGLNWCEGCAMQAAT